MKKMKKHPVLITLLALTALGQTTLAFAHDLTGSLGAASTAMDYYQVHCYNFGDGSGDTNRIYVAVRNNSTTIPKLSIQVIRDDNTGTTLPATATNTTDAANGNATFSPTIIYKGGNGFFYLAVDKTAVGAVNYSLQYHCEASDGGHTGTDIVQTINQ
ncbi:MAG: hypothetical protein PHH59_03265 [Methylovulum sp.]|uniref:hypothetical protein n=1 Tax=Methylovulum sp. TaxID=1916980 RepID=UPI0026392FAE|nr:hypothetical protein [Methylovulum sp.]MDD2723027.1 hypothetical protein [Methylovulum sp.]MDD5124769.1 hypothetical protein [Methylovulum sp.]